eukprot:gb/GECG01011575.1/.p1 GENE.gb/GECG01011575.1/~~gb/GECG01011575.1/.p1  ORF type:complete len:757 (+),score=97.71 gb/GECG01011575.1/:1-2271(+)
MFSSGSTQQLDPSGLPTLTQDQIHDIFDFYANFGRSAVMTVQETIDSFMFMKFARECPGLLGKDLTRTDVDLIFTKAKPKYERRIDFDHFLDALSAIAEKKYSEYSPSDGLRLLIANHLVPHYDLVMREMQKTGETEVPLRGIFKKLYDVRNYTGVYAERFRSGDGRINGESDNRVGRSFKGNTNTGTDEIIHDVSSLMRPTLKSGVMSSRRPYGSPREGSRSPSPRSRSGRSSKSPTGSPRNRPPSWSSAGFAAAMSPIQAGNKGNTTAQTPSPRSAQPPGASFGEQRGNAHGAVPPPPPDTNGRRQNASSQGQQQQNQQFDYEGLSSALQSMRESGNTEQLQSLIMDMANQLQSSSSQGGQRRTDSQREEQNLRDAVFENLQAARNQRGQQRGGSRPLDEVSEHSSNSSQNQQRRSARRLQQQASKHDLSAANVDDIEKDIDLLQAQMQRARTEGEKIELRKALDERYDALGKHKQVPSLHRSSSKKQQSIHRKSHDDKSEASKSQTGEMLSEQQILDIFQFYANFGRSAVMTVQDTMDSFMFMKFARECPGLLDRSLTRTDIDIIFTKAKPKFERRIAFTHFLDALSAIAEKKYPDDYPADGLRLLIRNHLVPHYDLVMREMEKTGESEVPLKGIFKKLYDVRNYTGVYAERFRSGDGRINGEADNRAGAGFQGNTNTGTDETIHDISVLMRPNLKSGAMSRTRSFRQGGSPSFGSPDKNGKRTLSPPGRTQSSNRGLRYTQSMRVSPKESHF